MSGVWQRIGWVSALMAAAAIVAVLWHRQHRQAAPTVTFQTPGGEAQESASVPLGQRQDEAEAAEGGQVMLWLRIFSHLCPDGVPEDTIFETPVGPDVTDVWVSTVVFTPQRTQTGEQIAERFGQPLTIERDVTKYVYVAHGGVGMPRMRSPVCGEVWDYGKLQLMIRDGKVAYGWVEDVVLGQLK